MNQESFNEVIEWEGDPGRCQLLQTSVIPASGIMPVTHYESESAESHPHESIAPSVRIVGPKISRFLNERDEVELLKKWEGYVEEILDDGFRVMFEAGIAGNGSFAAEFDFDELSEDDQQILSAGMPIIWCISRERIKGGLKRSSTVYLRRQSPPMPAEISAAADALHDWIETCCAGPASL